MAITMTMLIEISPERIACNHFIVEFSKKGFSLRTETFVLYEDAKLSLSKNISKCRP